VHPVFGFVNTRIQPRFPFSYYWSTYEREWGSDLVFRDPTVLKRLYHLLLHRAVTTFGSLDVVCLLLRKTSSHGGVNGKF
jgi:hypothetical protein